MQGMRRLTTLAVCAGFVTLTACARPARIERVVLLGFDGAAPNLIEPLVAQGRLPALRRLMLSGAYGHLRSYEPNKSGILWTSIATGKTMLKHGIVDWTYVNQQGIKVPYEDRGRRVKTYWEILSERGITTGTLNWWISYPPAPLPNGYVVSNAFKRSEQADSVHPPALFPLLNSLRVPFPDGVADEMKRQGIPEYREADASVEMHAARQILKSYPYYFSQDITIDRASDYLFGKRPVQVFSSYFRLPDVTSHFATHFLDRQLYDETVAREAAGTLVAEDVARLDKDFARVVAPAYAFMDRTIAKYLERLDGRTLLIVCSDHGFRYFHGRYNHANPAMQPPDGVVFVAGPGVRPAGRIEGAGLYDIAPTILFAMDQPAAEDMDGTPLVRAFDAAWLEAHPVARIASYEGAARVTSGASGSHRELDEKVLQDLKTLGYIGGDDEKH
jgi:predicted AlkP superfamily phosphohydrolase/phosphomutase